MGTRPVLYMPNYYCTIKERHLDKEDTIYKENALVQYDDMYNEYFYQGTKDDGYLGMQLHAKLIMKYLDNIEDKELEKEVNKRYLKGDIPNIEGALYVDESTLVKVKDYGVSRR